MEREWKPAPWLAGDRAWKWQLSQRFDMRLEKWSKRYQLLPGIQVDWEQQMLSLSIGWLNLWMGIDYEYAEHDLTEEVEYPY